MMKLLSNKLSILQSHDADMPWKKAAHACAEISFLSNKKQKDCRSGQQKQISLSNPFLSFEKAKQVRPLLSSRLIN